MSKEKSQEPKAMNMSSIRFRAMDFLGKTSHIEIKGNTLVNLEGSKGVLEYTSECIRIAADCFVVSISGRNLTLKCLSPISLTIEGFITNISFSD